MFDSSVLYNHTKWHGCQHQDDWWVHPIKQIQADVYRCLQEILSFSARHSGLPSAQTDLSHPVASERVLHDNGLRSSSHHPTHSYVVHLHHRQGFVSAHLISRLLSTLLQRIDDHTARITEEYNKVSHHNGQIRKKQQVRRQ